MLACKHYQRFEYETHIIPAEHIWNAWVNVYDQRGKLYYSSFETGLYAEYIHHLIENPCCRKEVGITKRELEKTNREIEKEWREVTRGDC